MMDDLSPLAIPMIDARAWMERGSRDGWVAALDWVIEILNEEIQFQENRPMGHGYESVKMLERLQMIYNNRRKAWMLSD